MNNNINNSTTDQMAGNPSKVTKAPTEVCADQGVASFFDAEPGFTTTVESSPDVSYDVGHTDITGIQDWLERPLEVDRFSHGIGGDPVHSFKPWELFFDNPAVKRKIDNYALIRCKLHVKVVVNAAPIWWGNSVLSYTPLTSMRVADVSDTNVQAMSMRPHIYMNPTTSQGGCLCLPFFYHKNWLNVNLKQDFTDMGTCNVRYLNGSGLRCSVNPTSQKVEYTVFVWASDVSLAQTTTELALQSKNEYASGPVSGIASTVANIAGKLVSVPFLKPYAKATEMAAGAIAGIAHIFGFSRTPILDNPSNVKSRPFGQTADCGTHELVDRLVVDPKNELCVDSRTVGLDGSDEMTISSIATREMFLGSAIWKELDPATTALFYSMVSPSSVHWYTPGSDAVTQPSPLAFAAAPFKYWRGDIVFRIMVAASGYHRGRLLIQWDPHNTITTATDVNEITSKIMDLSVTRDMEFRVPYAGIAPWLRTFQTDITASNYTFKTGAGGPLAIKPNTRYHNGAFAIHVLNPATGITDTNSTLDVQVFVRGADNFEVSQPIDLPDDVTYITSGYVLQSGDVPDHSKEEDFAPLGSDENTMIATTPVNADNTPLVCMGESIVSFRTLLKRYNYSRIQRFTIADAAEDNGVFSKYTSLMPRWPLARGLMNDGINEYVAGPGNISKNTLFNYLQGAFVGMRGSSRWKFNTATDGTLFEKIVSRMDKELTILAYSERLNVGYTTAASYDEIAFNSLPNFCNGGYALTNPVSQEGMEIDAPMYSRYRFISASPYSVPLGMLEQGTKNDSIQLQLGSVLNQNFDRTSITEHHAVGDDFSFFFFLQTPVWYRDDIVPKPLPV